MPSPQASPSPASSRPVTTDNDDHDPTMKDPKLQGPPDDLVATNVPSSAPLPAAHDGDTQPDVQDNLASNAAKSEVSSQADLIDLSGDSSAAPEPPSTPPNPDKGKNVEAVDATQTTQTESAPASDPMESSVATLKPAKSQYLSINTSPYVDPTPPTPAGSQPPSRSGSAHRSREHGPEPSPTHSDSGYDDRRYTSEDEREGESRSEIQSIMLQFPEGGGGPGEEEVMSPRLELTSPLLGSAPMQHPPRKSSLEPLAPSIAQQLQELRVSNASPASVRSRDKPRDADDQRPPVPPKDGPSEEDIPRSESTTTLHRPPPPEPEPEPVLPFDFHRFLDQLKNKKADPVARYLKSFLSEFGKRQWMVHEQVKIIGDFLAFIANKMAQCDVWRDVSDAEFDNAREGMEKLVMNRLYSQTFSPAIPSPQPIPGAKPKRRGGERPLGPGRRGQHQEDVERDGVLAQKISIYNWVREEHLDIPAVSDSGRRFLNLAQQGWFPPYLFRPRMLTLSTELLKIKSYRAPRDKIICVLNCCKVIFGKFIMAQRD